MEASIIVLFAVLGVSFITLIILLLTLKTQEPGKTVVVIKDKRTKHSEEKKDAKKEVKTKEQTDELLLNPTYCAINFVCDKCSKNFWVQEQKLIQDIICPGCKELVNKQEQFKKVMKAELKNQTKEQELFLGMCYLYGVGVKKDDAKAYLFVNLSAYNGDEIAKNMLKGYYCEEIAKLTKENIKDAAGDKLIAMIKEQKLQYNKMQFEPKTINELHNYAIDFFWWGTYHRMNCYDVEELATVGGASINSQRILNMYEGFEEIDLNSLESKLAIAYLEIAAKNGRYDLYAELGFAFVGSNNDKAKDYLTKGIACGDERSKELFAVYFEGKTVDQVRIEKLEAPKEVILLEQKSKSKIKSAEKTEAKEADAAVLEEKKEEVEISVDDIFGSTKAEEVKEAKEEKKEEKEKKPKKVKEQPKEKTEKKKPEDKKVAVVKKKKEKKEEKSAEKPVEKPAEKKEAKKEAKPKPAKQKPEDKKEETEGK